MSSRRLASAAAITCLLVLAAAASTHAQPAASPVPMGQLPPSAALGPALEGAPWRLDAYRRGATLRRVGPEVAARAMFLDGEVTGSDGCNRLRGRYATVGGRITITPGDRPDRTCAEQTAIVGQGLRAGLAAARRYVVTRSGDDDAALALQDEDGLELLRFVPDDVGALTAGEWRLERATFDGAEIVADPAVPALLAFQARRENEPRGRVDGQLIGSTGCNGLVAPFFLRGSVLSHGELEVTDAPCSGPSERVQAAMLALLEATAISVELPPDRLILTSLDAGDRLELVSTTPLEGTTWLVSRIAGAPEPATPVSLRLRDGVLSGEGPCGPISGRYVADGRQIEIGGLEGSATRACSEARRERQLLAALAEAALIRLEPPRLRLLDLTGRVVIRFERPGGP